MMTSKETETKYGGHCDGCWRKWNNYTVTM